MMATGSNIFRLLTAALFLLAASSCKTSFDEVRFSDGSADFTKVVAVGGSHLAGYSDMALYREAQSNSVPSILATRFAFADGGPFVQPLVNPGLGIGIQGNAKYTLQIVADPCGTGTTVVALPSAPSGDASSLNWIGNFSLYNNLAVPNTRIKNITDQTFGNPSPFLGNPLYARFASNPGSSTITGDALQQNPTFTIVWLGMEDVYNYARSGGKEGGDSISQSDRFDLLLSNFASQVASVGSSGIFLNIPDIDAIPFFTHIRHDGLTLNAAEAQQLNNLYAGVDTSISFTAGNNAYVVADTTLPTGRRQILPGEFILLSTPADSINCQGWGTTVPIPARYILDASEVQKIKNAIINYNSSITLAAVTNGFAVADIRSLLNQLKNGIRFNGVNYSTAHLKGGVFSIDGFHLSQRGAAMVANEVIDAINVSFSSKLPKADVSLFDGIIYP
jgi:hypothetical protein